MFFLFDAMNVLFGFNVIVFYNSLLSVLVS